MCVLVAVLVLVADGVRVSSSLLVLVASADPEEVAVMVGLLLFVMFTGTVTLTEA